MIHDILDRLTKVKKVGDSYVACCPAHPDKHPSLTIKETPDGRVLLHCFAQCPADAVLAAIGLELTDLFPEPLEHYLSPLAPRQRFPVAAVLECVAQEALICLLVGSQYAQGHSVPPEDHERLLTAVARLTEAKELALGL